MGACLACAACQTCVSVASICCSCLGCCTNSGGGDGANAPLVGRVRALTIMLISVVLAVAGQYWWYQLFDGFDWWNDGCDDEAYSEEFTDVCIGNTAVYRVSFVDAVFFALMALCACCSPVFNHGFWGFKFMLWAVLMIATLFITNDVFDTSGYVWVARIGAFIFTIMQQIVLIDLAYRINDGLVEKASEHGDDSEEAKPYLCALLTASGVLYTGSLCAIGAMFHYFQGCAENELVMSLTLILAVAITALQLLGGEGNLLASAVVTSYATFLCFSAVSKTPTSSCNPFVGESNTTVVLIGIALTVLSLFWVTLNAARTVTALLGGQANEVEEAPGPVQAPGGDGGGPLESGGGDKTRPFVQGAVTAQDQDVGAGASPRPATPASAGTPSAAQSDGGLGWRFNVVMVLISMFFGMMLTNWGDINEDGESSDPKNGWTAMWLTTTGQWVCYIIYAWTLVAPLVFPDRDFS
ncbi:conserved unknown protein [Ectocarpus siliculosus]|uniref:Uncharacterized protein n=1 Tax=Ectocarpus siliculosus TaxID=2880 RepID=D7G4C2_ECTSI|nr:conserved unknown protein [Ectocarpus siliculosus]|eukprot:CBJ27137.1 conserved unknown protein [Ectocarpus siliculosus]